MILRKFQKKRELYRGTKGMWRPGYGWDGNIWPGIFWDGSGRTHIQYDLDSDNNGLVNEPDQMLEVTYHES